VWTILITGSLDWHSDAPDDALVEGQPPTAAEPAHVALRCPIRLARLHASARARRWIVVEAIREGNAHVVLLPPAAPT
jgi:hypothetical protein